jgi:hypothetical protein
MDDRSSGERKEFTFNALDQIGIGFSEGAFQAGVPLPFRLFLSRLGPFIEFAHLLEAGVLPATMNPLIEAGDLAEFCGRFDWERSYAADGRAIPSGHLRLGDTYDDAEETRWTGFSIEAKHSAETLFPASLAGQLVGAVKEMYSNIFDHSGRSRTGLVAFAVHPSSFEVIVADRGIGVLESLRSNPAHASITSHGEALRRALEPGVSRHPDGTLHGHGFERMFTGLLNCNCSLRFRSGTAAIQIDGRSTGNPTPIITDRSSCPGFIISIECHL